ncbi:hypothetical protein [Pseudoalteromonas denitrificans]|uniref:Mu-like prophage I protein n=1 Tax=Pseudoalteromonas denitrificans DSM 6059 TaxID=1123010 RepID=A0A1I1T8R6_9GAMM|nr:hypothetical protein [Pseudoalteromonas denitrificans]SFD54982.1 hypothetical protein SAMN02745724_04821 [Pseudoalteromonas denitrificans DSM 6059]
MPKNNKSTNTQFAWFEIFKSGQHTDSKGSTQNFSDADLNSVVTNFSPKTSPLVIGHPKTDDPAWGWASELKVEDGVLFAKAEDVSAEFAQAVEDKRYPNRSVRLNAVDNGYELGHIGFLGGKPPAVSGLQWQFNADDEKAQVFEFAAIDKIESVALDTSNVLTGFFKNLRDFFIEKHDIETADKVIPVWSSDWLKEDTIIAEHEKRKESNDSNPNDFNEHNPNDENNSNDVNKEDSILTKEEQEALEDKLAAEQKKNAKLEYNQRISTARTFIEATINGGKSPRLTNTEGVAEFMADLEGDESKTFEFAASDGDKTQKPSEWFKSFLQGLPEQTKLTKDFSQGDDEDNADLTSTELASKASDYQQSQADKGIIISVSTAIAHIQGAK